MRQKQNKNILYCFSPPIMLSTFIIEIILAIYTFLKIKPSRLKNIGVATLVLLALFQLAEFFVCSTIGINGINIISRVGYISITLLLPLGLHLANEIGGRRKHWTIYLSYGIAVGFIAFFIIIPGSIKDSICTGNYVIFRMLGFSNIVYGTYYFGLLLAILITSVNLASRQKNKNKRSALHWLIAATLSFTLPVALIYFLAPSAGSAIPSVMCGFAIIYAIILALKILPLASKAK